LGPKEKKNLRNTGKRGEEKKNKKKAKVAGLYSWEGEKEGKFPNKEKKKKRRGTAMVKEPAKTPIVKKRKTTVQKEKREDQKEMLKPSQKEKGRGENKKKLGNKVATRGSR